MAKFICPFCIREYNKSEVLYVCPDCGKATTPNRFEREPIKCKTAKCGGLASLPKCPKCSELIPKMVLETPYLPISIIGTKNSGKTSYITTMLHELGTFSGLRLALGYLTKDAFDHQNENYSRIYEKHTRPDSTQGGANRPQIWCIKNLQKKHGMGVPAYTFTIYDGAGEDNENNLDPSSDVCRYINASKAIILAIDPLLLLKIREHRIVDLNLMGNSLAENEDTTKNIEDFINSVAVYIKQIRGMRNTQQLKIPVAVVLTKLDTLINHKLFVPKTIIRNRCSNIRNGSVDISEMVIVDQEIRSWLKEIGEGTIINLLKFHFKEFFFFGVSSYGSPPKDAYTLAEDIQPHRVLDPILWLFNKAKFID